MVICGGRNEDEKIFGDCHFFHLKRRKWVGSFNMGTARNGHSASLVNGWVWLMGGLSS